MEGLVRLLLDTHALLWRFTDDPRLSPVVREATQDASNELFVSAASAWEISTKQRLGKLPELPDVTSRFAELVAADGFAHLAVSYRHSVRAGGYGAAHRDPFDRVLAAQSERESLPLVTRDPAFAHFGTETFW